MRSQAGLLILNRPDEESDPAHPVPRVLVVQEGGARPFRSHLFGQRYPQLAG